MRSDGVRGGIYIQPLQPNKPILRPISLYTWISLVHKQNCIIMHGSLSSSVTLQKDTLPGSVHFFVIWHENIFTQRDLWLLPTWFDYQSDCAMWLLYQLHCCMCRETCRRRRKQFDSEALQADLQGSSVEGWPGQEAGREGGVGLVKWEMLHFTTLAQCVHTLHFTESHTLLSH